MGDVRVVGGLGKKDASVSGLHTNPNSVDPLLCLGYLAAGMLCKENWDGYGRG